MASSFESLDSGVGSSGFDKTTATNFQRQAPQIVKSGVEKKKASGKVVDIQSILAKASQEGKIMIKARITVAKERAYDLSKAFVRAARQEMERISAVFKRAARKTKERISRLMDRDEIAKYVGSLPGRIKAGIIGLPELLANNLTPDNNIA